MAKRRKSNKKASKKKVAKRSTLRSSRRSATGKGDGAPPKRLCATDVNHERLLRTAPGYADGRAAVENHCWRAMRSGMAGRSGCTKIPVVVHVLYKTAVQNISDAQINSQIDVLKQDFRKKNADVSTVPAAFAPLADDARVEFERASEDPSGNPTSGIVRHSTSKSSFLSDESMKFASSGGADAWPRDRYLNIWVCELSDYLGYAQFPGGPANTDGVVIRHRAFGTTGTAIAPFDGGRTTTHEVGHWLNLRHIWGDDGTGCSGSDFVTDTPNQGGENYGVPAFPNVSCGNGPNGDMFMNYMDYVDDQAMVMFTTGQVARMQAALDGARSSIGMTVSCGTKPPLADVTTKFTDDPVKLKFKDDIAKFKFVDDPASLKFSDDGSNPFIDPIKLPSYDKSPFSDWFGGGLFGGFGFRAPAQPGCGGAGTATPFVLSTPHHSSAWTGSFPGAAEARRGQLQQQMAALHQQLGMAMQARAAGQLSADEMVQVEQMQAEFSRLQAENAQLTQGAG